MSEIGAETDSVNGNPSESDDQNEPDAEISWDESDIGQDPHPSHCDSTFSPDGAVFSGPPEQLSETVQPPDSSETCQPSSTSKNKPILRNEIHVSLANDEVWNRNLQYLSGASATVQHQPLNTTAANSFLSSSHSGTVQNWWSAGAADMNSCHQFRPVESPSSTPKSQGSILSQTVTTPGESPLADQEINNQRIFQDGLGLFLRDPPSNAEPSNQDGQVPHNWQANKPSVKSRLAYMLATGALSDIIFVVGGSSLLSSCSNSMSVAPETIQGHKFVLSMGSSVFDAMFNGSMASQADNCIQIPDVEPSAFRAMLTFLYTDEVMIGSDTVMAVLYASKKYNVTALEGACVEFLKDNISCDNAFMLLSQARLFDEEGLARMCLDAIDKSTCEALASDSFTEIDQQTLCSVLGRDSLGIRESKLFSAVTKWAECECVRRGLEMSSVNQREVLGPALRMIRYPLMTVEEFSVQVAQTKILTDSELVELFLYFTINPKPSITFTDIPRCCLTGKEQVVSRFCQIDHRWGYSGTSDRIKFIVTKKIYVAGFGVYGSVNGPAEYSATIEILSGDTQRVLGSKDTSFTCDGSSSTFRIMFTEPIEIAPCVHYYAAVTLKGPDSYYGTKGLRKVTHESAQSGKVSFQFSYAAGNNNGTSVEDGQIPEIMFYT